jgi:hypothetical protein
VAAPALASADLPSFADVASELAAVSAVTLTLPAEVVEAIVERVTADVLAELRDERARAQWPEWMDVRTTARYPRLRGRSSPEALRAPSPFLLPGRPGLQDLPPPLGDRRLHGELPRGTASARRAA